MTTNHPDSADELARAAEKIAPVQGYTPGIPWSLHLEAYDAYRKKWGPQPALIDLEGRHCRGGFGTSELDEFIPGWRDKVSEIGKLRARVAELESELTAYRTRPAPETAGEVVAYLDVVKRLRGMAHGVSLYGAPDKDLLARRLDGIADEFVALGASVIAEDTPAPAQRMSEEQERAGFEQWAKDYGRIFLKRAGDGYEGVLANEAWVAWQARAAWGVKEGDAA